MHSSKSALPASVQYNNSSHARSVERNDCRLSIRAMIPTYRRRPEHDVVTLVTRQFFSVVVQICFRPGTVQRESPSRIRDRKTSAVPITDRNCNPRPGARKEVKQIVPAPTTTYFNLSSSQASSHRAKILFPGKRFVSLKTYSAVYFEQSVVGTPLPAVS